MARNISVKVPTSSLIASVEQKIAEIDQAIADYPAVREAYEKEVEAYKQNVATFVADYLSKNLDKVGYDHNSVVRVHTTYNGRIELTFDKESIANFPKEPKEPQRPNSSEWFGREHTTKKQLLEKNLKILRMTTQDEVNASTYGAILELL